MYRLSKEERETHIWFNEAEQMAEVYTINSRIKRKLKELSETYPDRVKFINEDKYGFVRYLVDKTLISIRKPMDIADTDQRKNSTISKSFGNKDQKEGK